MPSGPGHPLLALKGQFTLSCVLVGTCQSLAGVFFAIRAVIDNIPSKEYNKKGKWKKDNTHKWLREKTQKTPRSVLELAKSYKKDYEDRFN